ncbi:MAG TPA: hypothetical protein VGA04_16240 [Streptosporangiaceae bacterium]|nr:hypothetical protein [Streptosporangiaceae bacterium]
MFGTTEHRRRSAARAEAALRRATAWLGPSDGPASDGPGPHGPASDGPASDGPARDRQTRKRPIGFAQREFEITPGQHASRWYAEPIMAGHAVAWNPSLPGGGWSEDTYLVSAGGVRQRVSISPGWPTEPDDTMRPPRPAVLEVGT